MYFTQTFEIVMQTFEIEGGKKEIFIVMNASL